MGQESGGRLPPRDRREEAEATKDYRVIIAETDEGFSITLKDRDGVAAHYEAEDIGEVLEEILFLYKRDDVWLVKRKR